MGVIKSVQKAVAWTFNIAPEERVRLPLDPGQIKESEHIKALLQQNQGLQAQIAKMKAIEFEKEEAKKAENYQDKIVEKLLDEEKKIKQKRFKHSFSLRYFFNSLGHEKRPTKFAKDMDVTDKDDKIIFGKFGDIQIVDNGYFVIKDDKGKTLSTAQDITQLIWKPDGLVNYMKRRRIPLAIDEDRNPAIDLEEIESPELMFDENEPMTDENGEAVLDSYGKPKMGNYRQTIARYRPIKEILIEKDIQIRNLMKKLERQEAVTITQRDTIYDLNRVVNLLENRASTSQAKISDVMSKYISFENKMGDMQSQIVKQTELKSLYENMTESYKTIIERLMARIEYHGGKTMQELIKADMKDDIDFFYERLPEKVPYIPEQKAESPPPKPGQPLSQTS